MNSKYTGKLVEDLLDKMSIIESGEVGGVISGKIFEKFLRKDQDDRTLHTLASDKLIEVGNFVSGTSGAIIYVDKATGHTVAELDKLYVRMKAYFELLEIINVNSVGGKLIVSPAGGIKCSLVETYDSWGYYRCYFLSELDGEKIENRFAVGDLAYSKTFNAREGSYNKISNRYYWRLVVGRGENYIDLSKTDCDADSDEPQEGDVIVHRGNRNDVDRLNCLEFSSVDSFSPSITLYQGINDYSLSDKNVIQFGVEKSTGKAFMNVYGDMFIGNRDNSSYIRYSPEKGVEIKGKLDIGTSFGDKTLLDAIDLASTAYEEDLNNLKDIVNRDILNILNLLDGAIETWFYDPAPTLTNLPASLWTTESDRNIHLGDLYYSGAGRAYRFQYDADNSLYYWQEIVDTDIVLALENAKKAQDTADSKRKIFVRKPEASDSYDIGDMWVNATYSDSNVTYTEDLLRAILSKEIGEQFSITHWTLASKYTDDTVANDALQKATEAQNSVNELLNSVGDFKDYVDNAFLDGIIDTSEAQAIEKYINLLNTIKLQVDKSYEEIIKNSILENTLYLTNLNNSYTAFSSSYTELINTINSAISDSKTTDLEKAAVDGKYKTFNDKYRDYTAYLNLAINYIEETINGKVERALLDIGGYKYLKAALLENTSIEGGLIQSSMLSLGYTKNNLFLVMAGTNGLVLDKGDRTIASWFGGGMIDMFDYYDSNTKTFNVPEDVRAAAGLDRMDGTGYRAKGNLWWDESGVVHADPLSFFVGESTVGGLLASFLVVMKEDGKHPLYLIPQVPFLSLEIADYIRIGDALLKYDSASKAIYVTSADGTTSMGFYASGYVSALGKNSSGGSIGSASALYQLADVVPNSTNDGVLNAVNGSVLMYNGSKWQAGNVITDISPLTLNVNGSSLFTYDGKSSITANLTVPTKVSQLTNDSGYLTAITKAQVEGVLTGNITSHTHSYLPLSGGKLIGSLEIDSTGSSWNEGIRIHAAPNGFCGVILCGTDNTGSAGTSATTWSAYNSNGNFYINRNASALTSAYILCNVNGNWGIGTNSPSYKLHVAGDIYTTTGFKKNGSSDSYVLLGGGGHKLLTDFAMSGDYVKKSSDTFWGTHTYTGSSHIFETTSAGTLTIFKHTGSGTPVPFKVSESSSTNESSDSYGVFQIERLNTDNGWNNAGASLYFNLKDINGDSAEVAGISGINTSDGKLVFRRRSRTVMGTMDSTGLSITGRYSGASILLTNSSRQFITFNQIASSEAGNGPWVLCQLNGTNKVGIGWNNSVGMFFEHYYNSSTYALLALGNSITYNGWSLLHSNNYTTYTNQYFKKAGDTISSNGYIRWADASLELAVHNSRLSLATTNQSTTMGMNVGSLLVSSAWADSSKVPTNGIYTKGYISGTGFKLGNGFHIENRAGLRLNSRSTEYPSDILFGHKSGDSDPYDSWTNVYWAISARGSGEDYRFSIWRGSALTSEQEFVTFTKELNVGIGTTNPTQKLYVNGLTYSVNGFAVANGRLVNNTVSGNGFIMQDGNGTNLAEYSYYHDHAYVCNYYGSTENVGIEMFDNGNFSIFTKESGKIFYALNNGNVGIGTTSPEYKLHISSGPVGDALKLQSSQAYTCVIYQHSGSYSWSVGANTSNTFYFWNTYKSATVAQVDINGNFSSIGAVTAKASSSDIRLKTDISDYKALSIIRGHKSIKYHWNAVAKANADIFNDNDWHFGLIAQEMQQDFPQMVSDVFKDYLVINYERLIPICWKGLQEVDDEVTKLKKKVRKLEMEIRELKQKEDRL